MMELYLIRHGECFSPANEYYDRDKKTMNPPLTEKGTRQARQLAERCKTIGFDKVFSSDLTRAVQTAENILKVAPCDYFACPAFREIDMGEIHAKSWSAFPELHAQWLLHNEDIPYPSGENGEDVWKRCRVELEEIIKNRYQKVAIVMHGGTIRAMICGLLDLPQQRRFYFGYPPENCSITIVKYREEEERFYLHSFNDVSHLSD